MVTYQNYKIRSDGTQLTLTKTLIYKKKDTGEPYEVDDTVGYYSTVEGVLRGIHKDIMLGEVQTHDYNLNALVGRSTAAWNSIEAALKDCHLK